MIRAQQLPREARKTLDDEKKVNFIDARPTGPSPKGLRTKNPGLGLPSPALDQCFPNLGLSLGSGRSAIDLRARRRSLSHFLVWVAVVRAGLQQCCNRCIELMSMTRSRESCGSARAAELAVLSLACRSLYSCFLLADWPHQFWIAETRGFLLAFNACFLCWPSRQYCYC